ncbi:MAG TPA: hypothetical protein VF928_09695 [Usitatibacteraceae bacterium]
MKTFPQKIGSVNQMKLLLCLLALGFITLVGCGAATSPNTQALEKQKIVCPLPARLEYVPWGKSGLMAICKVDHGPFAAAENGKILLIGENAQGKPTGEWRWFNSNGDLEKSEIMK